MRFSAKTPNIYYIEKDLYVRLRCRRSDMLNWYLIFKRQDEERAIDITVIKNLLQNFVDIISFSRNFRTVFSFFQFHILYEVLVMVKKITSNFMERIL